MNGFSNYHADAALRFATERMAGYRAEAANGRLAWRSRGVKPVGALANALGTLRSAFSSVDADSSLGTPRLTGYPFRG